MKIRKFLGFSFILLGLSAGAVSLYGAQTVLPIRVEGADIIIRGQDSPTEKKSIGLGERFKRFFVNLTKDGENNGDSSPVESNPQPVPPSIPTKPPKPPTAAEIQQAVENPEKQINDRRSSTPATPEAQAFGSRSASGTEPAKPVEPEETENSIFQRLKEIRMQVFDKQTLRENRTYQEIYGERTERQPVVSERSSDEDTETSPASVTAGTAVPERTLLQRTPPSEPAILENSAVSRAVKEAEQDGSAVEEPLPLNTPRTANNAVNGTANASNNTANNTTDDAMNKSVPYSPYQQYQNPNPAKVAPLSRVDVNVGSTASRQNTRSAQPSPTVSSPKTLSEAQTEEYPVMNRQILSSDTGTNQNNTANAEKTSEPVLDKSAQSTPVGEKTLNEPPRVSESIPMKTALESEKKVLVSPRLEVGTECPPKVMVGQEAVYQIRVSNKGGASAEQVVLSVEIPDWLEILQPDVSAGTTSIVPRSGQKEPRDFVWKISRIEPDAEELLVLHLVPQQRRSVDLRIRYDFFRPQAVAKIVVQEPVLEMELQGPDEVIWGSKVQYRLVVRNTGNGDAENILLELLQTGSDMRTCPLPLLEAGREQAIEVLVWTGKQEHIDINIQATGDFGLKSNIIKQVKVLRPNVVMTVEAPSIQFVGNPAEFQVKVHNEGDAVAEQLTLVANLPLGSQFISCSDGGELTPENQIRWNVESIPVGETFNASVVCLPKREGNCKMETTINDKSGVLAQCSGSLEAQAIVDLKLDMEYPNGPVEVGSEAVYTISIVNRGMKTAENVEVVTAFADGVEPKAVEGTNAYMSDGQVFFDKITTMAAGQKTVLKIKTKADKPGNHRVRTVVVCKGANINLVNEQATYFYQKQGEKSRKFSSSNIPSAPASESEPENDSEPKVASKPEPAQSVEPAEAESAETELEPSSKQSPLDPTKPLP